MDNDGMLIVCVSLSSDYFGAEAFLSDNSRGQGQQGRRRHSTGEQSPGLRRALRPTEDGRRALFRETSMAERDEVF